MTNIEIANINDSLVRIASRIHTLQNLIIDYHSHEKPWYESWGPYIIAVVASLLAIWGQIRIFKLSRKKEIDIKVAELYGKLNAIFPEYNIQLWRYNKQHIAYIYYSFLETHYAFIVSQEEWGSDLLEKQKDDIFRLQKSYMVKKPAPKK